MFVPLSHLDREGSDSELAGFHVDIERRRRRSGGGGMQLTLRLTHGQPHLKESTRRNFWYLFADRPSRALIPLTHSL